MNVTSLFKHSIDSDTVELDRFIEQFKNKLNCRLIEICPGKLIFETAVTDLAYSIWLSAKADAKQQFEQAPKAMSPSSVSLQSVNCNSIPPIGAKVDIYLPSRDKWVQHTVTGYYNLVANVTDASHQVNICVMDSEGFHNSRMLRDVIWPSKCVEEVAAKADTKQPLEQDTPAPVYLEPVIGDMLPPIGAKVDICLTSRDEWVQHTVTGYYVWPALPGDDSNMMHRVNIRVIDKDGCHNARMLRDVIWPSKIDAEACGQ